MPTIERSRPWTPTVIAWVLLFTGMAGMAWAMHRDSVNNRTIIERKNRLISSVMYHRGWTAEQIEAIASGAIGPYSPEARPGNSK